MGFNIIAAYISPGDTGIHVTGSLSILNVIYRWFSIYISVLSLVLNSAKISCGLSNRVRKPSFYTFSVDLVEIGVVNIQVYRLKSVQH